MDKLLTIFKKQLIDFCDELIGQFPLEGDFLVMKMFIENQAPTKTIIELFNKQLDNNNERVRNMIIERNENFFLNENPFSFVSGERMNRLTSLWTNESTTPDDKEIIWNWVSALETIARKYNDRINITANK
jgi:hypothetical protein